MEAFNTETMEMTNVDVDLAKILKNHLKKALRKLNTTYIISTLQDPEFVSDEYYTDNIICTICGYQVTLAAINIETLRQVMKDFNDYINSNFDNIHITCIFQNFNINIASFTITFNLTTMPDDED